MLNFSAFSPISLCLCEASFGVVVKMYSLHGQRLAPIHPPKLHPKCAAAAFSLTSAARVSFRRHQPGLPLHKNVNSAASRERLACQFGGFCAKFAICATAFALEF